VGFEVTLSSSISERDAVREIGAEFAEHPAHPAEDEDPWSGIHCIGIVNRCPDQIFD
jgi:hypothetical protein